MQVHYLCQWERRWNICRDSCWGSFAVAVSCGNSITLPVHDLADRLIANQLVRLEKAGVLIALAVVKNDPNTSEHYMLQPVKVLV